MSPPPPEPTILIIDDNREWVSRIQASLQREGFTTAAVPSAQEALQWLERHSPRLLLLERRLPDLDGMVLINRLKSRNREFPFLVMTDQGDEREAVTLIKLGAIDYLVKDAEFELWLPEVIRCSLKQIEQEQKLAEAEARLRMSEQRLRLMVEHLPAGAVYVEGQQILFNKATEQITGFTQAEITTVDDWFRLLYGEKCSLVYSYYQQDKAKGFPQPRVVSITRRDGRLCTVEFTAFGFEGGEVWLLHDVTKREQAERILRTEFAITRLFTQSFPEVDAAPQLLQVICEGLDWDLGELWSADPKSAHLRRRALWHVPALQASQFLALGSQLTLARGAGLPGRVWASGQPAFVENIAADPGFLRTDAAAKAGFRSAFGFPIQQKAAVTSVLIFFSRQERPPDSDLLTAMSDLGRRISNYVERKRAEEALRQSEKRLQAIFDHSPAVLYLKDPEGHYLLVNRQFEKLCAIPAHQIRGKKDADLFPPDNSKMFRANDQAVLAGRKPMKFEEWLPGPRGGHLYLSVKFPLFDQAGEVYALCGISTDMTELKQLEREILRISDAEQRRIGQDLHDGLCQQLAGIEFISQALEQKLASQNIPEAAAADQIANLIRETITHTRNLAKGLSPVILEPDGLMSSLKMLAANISNLFGVHCRFYCPKPVLLRDNSVATHLFRIAQEAVNNAIRHGSAKHLDIRLTTTPSHITLAIKDDGPGIPLPLPKDKGMGLRIMQYRASVLESSLAIQNPKKGGTSILCRVPQNLALQRHEQRQTNPPPAPTQENPDRR